MAKKKQTYEDASKRLGEIVDALNEEGLTLEKSLALYKEGVVLAKYLKDTLKEYEGEITILRNSLEGGAKEEPFTPAGE